jgi:cytochrome c553
MKNSLKLFLLLLVSAVILPGFISPNPPAAAVKVKYSKKVNAIIQNKCYGCHSPQGRGEKARQKLNWDELPTQSPDVQLEKVTSILGVLDKGAMPPKFMTEKDPSKALTEKETAQMKKWASKLSKKLSK